MAIYTNEQIIKIRENLRNVNVDVEKILKVIEQKDDIDYKNIPEKTEISKFIIDKCLAALIGSGLIKMTIRGVRRSYKITEDGKNLLNLK